MLAVLVTLGMLWQLGAGTTGHASGVAPGGSAAAPAAPTRVLLLHMSPRVAPAVLAIEEGFRTTFGKAVGQPVAFHSEYFEQTAFADDESLQEEIAAYLRAKYSRTKLDVVAVTSSRGLRFAVRHRASLFPGVPIAFAAVDKAAAADVRLPDDVSGVWLSLDWTGTLEAALRLQPDTERAVVVTGASAFDQTWAAAARVQFASPRRPIEITYLVGLPIETLVQRLAALPRRTVVLLGAFSRDGAGQEIRSVEQRAPILTASTAPVYSVGGATFGHGVVGGHVVSFEAQGQRQAEIAAQLLRGQRPSPTDAGTNVYRFDARQIRRWGLDARRLPPGSDIAFAEPSVWQTYRGYIVAALGVLALQTWLIVGLLANRAQRRRARRALDEQLRFETLVSDVLATLIMQPADGVDAQIRRALARIAADLDVDRIVLEEHRDKHAANVTHGWTGTSIRPVPASIDWSEFPWMAGRVDDGHVVVASLRQSLPAEAETDRQSMLARGIHSMLAVPLVLEGAVVGVLSCATGRPGLEWREKSPSRCGCWRRSSPTRSRDAGPRPLPSRPRSASTASEKS